MNCFLIILSACGQASKPTPSISVTVSSTDPSGIARVEETFLSMMRREGPTCASATWYGFGGTELEAEFVVSDPGDPVVFDADYAPAEWWEGAEDEGQRLFLHGGTGTLIALDDDHLEYEISLGEVHYRDSVLDEDLSYPQPEPITILIEGELDEFPPSELPGEVGFATDVDGNALCSGDDRNW